MRQPVSLTDKVMLVLGFWRLVATTEICQAVTAPARVAGKTRKFNGRATFKRPCNQRHYECNIILVVNRKKAFVHNRTFAIILEV